MMRRRYSRKNAIDQKKNIRSALLLIFLTISLILVIIFLGVPLVVKYAGLITDLTQSNSPVEQSDTTPPPPPRIDDLPQSTNQLTIDVNGSTEPGATVVVTINGKESDVLANKSGRFSLTVNLNNGENTIKAYAKDVYGNASTTTHSATVLFDNTPPSIEISNPPSNSSFYGTKWRQISIEGSTEHNARVTVNERFVVVGNDGKFKTTTNLENGENTFIIKAEDDSGNASEVTLKINYSE
ncbi:hypothetical protein IPM62_04130 [Candidatus Woesebacteria bacterium]|nr:MAG: hypothetical protein IPM62_04130 [Candidatus Woesebacteria bacterium]